MLVCDDCAQADLDVLVNYLQINRRHRIIEDCLSSMDDVMTRAVSYSPGLRLVDQEPWECLISYILSANNSIPLITRAIEKISARWGCPIESREGVFYSFPTPEQLADATEEELYDCKTGFRAKYVLGALSGVLSGEIDLEEIKDNGLSVGQGEPHEESRALGESVRLRVVVLHGKVRCFPGGHMDRQNS